jgi:hypothetical protein
MATVEDSWSTPSTILLNTQNATQVAETSNASDSATVTATPLFSMETSLINNTTLITNMSDDISSIIEEQLHTSKPSAASTPTLDALNDELLSKIVFQGPSRTFTSTSRSSSSSPTNDEPSPPGTLTGATRFATIIASSIGPAFLGIVLIIAVLVIRRRWRRKRTYVPEVGVQTTSAPPGESRRHLTVDMSHRTMPKSTMHAFQPTAKVRTVDYQQSQFYEHPPPVSSAPRVISTRELALEEEKWNDFDL